LVTIVASRKKAMLHCALVMCGTGRGPLALTRAIKIDKTSARSRPVARRKVVQLDFHRREILIFSIRKQGRVGPETRRERDGGNFSDGKAKL
jgi:hypothetical protein